MSFSKRVDGIAEWLKQPQHVQAEMLRDLIVRADTLRQFAMYFTLQQSIAADDAEHLVEKLKDI